MSTIFLQPNQTTDGTSSNDSIFGSSGNDTVYGLDGNDFIYLSDVIIFYGSVDGGNDIIYGGAGHDDVTGGSGNDYFDGADGDDYFTPGGGNNTFIGGAGIDRLVYEDEKRSIYIDLSEAGLSEVLLDGISVDRITGVEEVISGYGNDYIKLDTPSMHGFYINNGGVDTLIGGIDVDTFHLYESSGTLEIDGGLGLDAIHTGVMGYDDDPRVYINLTTKNFLSGAVVITYSNIEQFITGSGDDTISEDSDTSVNYFATGRGNDIYIAGLGQNWFHSGDGLDTLDLSLSMKAARTGKDYYSYQNITADGVNFFQEVEKIVLTNFDDKLSIKNTSFSVEGGLGKDTITGGIGNDSISGGDGNDSISGGAGNDLLEGGMLNDKINGSTGADFILGGDGNDTINGGAGDDIIYAQEGNDIVTTTSGIDWVYGGEGNDKITGSRDSDHLEGDGGNDTIIGAAGNDALWGSGGNDIIKGDAGADHIWGGAGNDTLTGGSGIDRFHFGWGALSASDVDTITDFKGDEIYLYADPFTNHSFISVSRLSQANSGEGIIYEKSTGTLYYDVDGAGEGEMAIAFVNLVGKPNVTIDNFTFPNVI